MIPSRRMYQRCSSALHAVPSPRWVRAPDSRHTKIVAVEAMALVSSPWVDSSCGGALVYAGTGLQLGAGTASATVEAPAYETWTACACAFCK